MLACLLGLALTPATLTSCTWDAVNVKLPRGEYRLLAVDSKDQLCVAEDGTIWITALVVEAGWNDHYIVAANSSPDVRGLSWYIDLDYVWRTKPDELKKVVGPLTEEEYQRAKVALGLPEFTFHYWDLR